jgi:hypothetical protein
VCRRRGGVPPALQKIRFVTYPYYHGEKEQKHYLQLSRALATIYASLEAQKKGVNKERKK